jgi:phage terminase large subunit GpA-like protein
MSRFRKVNRPGWGYAHFPDHRDEEWFKQLTGERLITRYDRAGNPIREWHRTYHAVEALDCRVYALAALYLSDIDLERVSERRAAKDRTIKPVRKPTEETEKWIKPPRQSQWLRR